MRLIAGARITVLSSAAVLLSGCSWLGFGGSQYQSHNQSQYGARYVNAQTQYNPNNARHTMGRCQISNPSQRIPNGCRHEDVTLALGGPQGQYGQAAYTNNGYGSHAANVQNVQAAPKQKSKRPLLRGQFGLEIDHSISGDLYDPNTSNSLVGFSSTPFHPRDGARVNTPSDGVTYTLTNFSSTPVSIEGNNISFDDVYTAPLRLSAGLELILNDKNTVFANAGYTRSEGKKGGSVDVIETIRADSETTFYDGDQLAVARFNEPLERDAVVAKATFDFGEMQRLDVELGGRHYFNPVFRESLERPLTPFVSASGGMAYYSDINVRQSVEERSLGYALAGEVDPEGDFVDGGSSAVTTVTGSQWVPQGALKAGLEWQISPKTALAFEAGVKYEGGRELTGGEKGDAIISVPVAIRGSYNF